MADYLVVVKIKCDCKTWINLRAEQTTYGGVHMQLCWNCNSAVELRGNTGYVNGVRVGRERFRLISRELKK